MSMLINALGVLLIMFVVYWFWWPTHQKQTKKRSKNK